MASIEGRRAARRPPRSLLVGIALAAAGGLKGSAAAHVDPSLERCTSGRRATICGPPQRLSQRELSEQLALEEAFLERALAAIGAAPGFQIDVTLYADREDKGIATGSVWEESSDRQERVHRIVGWRPDFVAEAGVLLGRLGYATGIDSLDSGLAIALTRRWQGWPLERWAQLLERAGLLLEPTELIDPPRFQQHSYLYVYPAAALRILHRIETAGGWKPAAAELRGGGLVDWMRRAEPPGFADWVRTWARAAPPRPLRPLGSFQRGICLAHSYTSLSSGYLSRRAAEQMRYLRDRVHVSAVSITPFAYIAGVDDPEIRHRERVRGAARLREESDEAVSAAIESAHHLGLEVLLAPHLWGAVWCGEWGAQDPESWRRLFSNYERFILHYALLAELRGADMLQVGKELVRATRGRGAEWRRILTRVRSVYRGPITYGAHWDQEFERIDFVDALDLAGINAYAPLCTGRACSDSELRRAAERQANRIERWARRWNRPVLLTEVGFPGAPHAAERPWQDGAAAADLELQAACYRAILDSFGSRPWCAGMFWWKWFTDPALHRGPARASDFPPAGKPAEAVLATIYERIATRPAAPLRP